MGSPLWISRLPTKRITMLPSSRHAVFCVGQAHSRMNHNVEGDAVHIPTEHMIRMESAEISGNSPSQNSKDANEKERLYKEFAEKIGVSSDTTPKSKGEKSEEKEDNYAKFAEKLGIGMAPKAKKKNDTRAEKEGRVRSAQLDPADYTEFNELLRKKGNLGKKIRKGSRAFASFEQSRLDMSVQEPTTSQQPADQALDLNVETSTQTSRGNDTTFTSDKEFSKSEDAARSYSLMRETFGKGFHEHLYKPSARSSMRNETKTPPSPELLQAPKRPGVPDSTDSNESSGKMNPVSHHSNSELQNTILRPPLEMKPPPKRPKPVETIQSSKTGSDGGGINEAERLRRKSSNDELEVELSVIENQERISQGMDQSSQQAALKEITLQRPVYVDPRMNKTPQAQVSEKVAMKMSNVKDSLQAREIKKPVPRPVRTITPDKDLMTETGPKIELSKSKMPIGRRNFNSKHEDVEVLSDPKLLALKRSDAKKL